MSPVTMIQSYTVTSHTTPDNTQYTLHMLNEEPMWKKDKIQV